MRLRRSHALALAWIISSINLARPPLLGAAPPVKAIVVKNAVSPLSIQQINQIMDFLKTTEPDVYKKAVMLRHSHPAKFSTLIAEAAPNFACLERMRKTDPKLLSLTLQDLADTHESFKIAGELRQPGLPSAAAQLLRARLRQVVTAQFDVRQQIRMHELNALVKKINELKTQMKHRETRRQKIIDRRVAQLIGKPPSVNW